MIKQDELENYLKKQIDFIKKNQLPNGLWTASVPKNSINLRPEYTQYVWPRDCVFIIRSLLLAGERETAQRGLDGLLKILRKNEDKLDRVIGNPKLAFGKQGNINRFMPRYRPKTLEEVVQDNGVEWSNFQNDVLGEILWLFGNTQNEGFNYLKNKKNRKLFQKLVSYVAVIRFWKDQDGGFWEDSKKLRSSSVAAVTSGLKAVSPFLTVPNKLIEQGEKLLRKRLANGVEAQTVDSVLLYTIDPFGMASRENAKKIVKRIEDDLLKEKGCIRWPKDNYNTTLRGNCAVWPKFLFKLAIAYALLGNKKKSRVFLKRGLKRQINYLFPEAFSGDKPINYPLIWTSAECINAILIISNNITLPPLSVSPLIPSFKD